MFEIITTKRREELELKISSLDNRVRNLTADRSERDRQIAVMTAAHKQAVEAGQRWQHKAERAFDEIDKTARVLESLYARRALVGIGAATVVSFFVGVATVILSIKWELLQL